MIKKVFCRIRKKMYFQSKSFLIEHAVYNGALEVIIFYITVSRSPREGKTLWFQRIQVEMLENRKLRKFVRDNDCGNVILSFIAFWNYQVVILMWTYLVLPFMLFNSVFSPLSLRLWYSQVRQCKQFYHVTIGRFG